MEHLSKIATTIEFTEENIEPLVEVALTTLSSKIVNKSFLSPVLTLRFKRQMAEIAVRAVLSVADLPRRDVRFDLIKLTVRDGLFAESRRKRAASWRTRV